MSNRELLLLAAYFVFISSYVSEAALPPVCPVRNGYVANPRNCSQFVHCLNYNVTGVGACPKNLYFSQSRIACVPYYMANCSDVHHCEFIFFADFLKLFFKNQNINPKNTSALQIVTEETFPKWPPSKKPVSVVLTRKTVSTRIFLSVDHTMSAKTAFCHPAIVLVTTSGAPNWIDAISRRTVTVPSESSYCPTQRPVLRTWPTILVKNYRALPNCPKTYRVPPRTIWSQPLMRVKAVSCKLEKCLPVLILTNFSFSRWASNNHTARRYRYEHTDTDRVEYDRRDGGPNDSRWSEWDHHEGQRRAEHRCRRTGAGDDR